MAYSNRSSIRKTWNLFKADSDKPFKLSRSKIDLFVECPRCFYLDRRLGVARPQGPSFTLNSAVDHLLKKEFDIHRKDGKPHPMMVAYGIDAIPFSHKELDTWRENFQGIQFLHNGTNFLITGAVDDVWVNSKGDLHIVDYKSTSKDGEVELTDAKWHNQYRRQMEIYQWLFRKNGFSVSSTGYFVYVNGKKDRAAFDGKLEFDVKVIPYEGDDSWVEKTILKAKECLSDPRIPKKSASCEHCEYFEAIVDVVKTSLMQKPLPEAEAEKEAPKKVLKALEKTKAKRTKSTQKFLEQPKTLFEL